MTNRNKDKFCIEKLVDKLANAIVSDSGPIPVILLDTGAVIDFEREYLCKCKLKNPNDNIGLWYGLLEQRISPRKLYVSEYVFNEMKVHSNVHRINGKPEISLAHLEILNAFNRDYINSIKKIGGIGLSFEEAYNIAIEVSEQAFTDDEKKRQRDPISRNDLGLLATAIWTLHTTVPIDAEGRAYEKVSTSIIISADRHITKTVTELAKEHDGIKAINHRRILGDGLR